MLRRTGLYGFVTFSLASWAISYRLITDNVTESSSLIQQTLFNMKSNSLAQRLLGNDIEISSRISGQLNQIKGTADVQFQCSGSTGTLHKQNYFDG